MLRGVENILEEVLAAKDIGNVREEGLDRFEKARIAVRDNIRYILLIKKVICQLWNRTN
jgi:hypothetical protein